MHAAATFFLKLLGSRAAQQIIVVGLEAAAKRSDNTVDDQIVRIVKDGLSNRINPIQRQAGK